MKFETTILDPDPQSLSKTLAEIYAYWESKRGDYFAPSWDEFHLDELDPSVVPLSVVVDVIADPLDFVYRFQGTARNRVEVKDSTGHSVLGLNPPEMGKKFMASFRSSPRKGRRFTSLTKAPRTMERI